MSAEREDPATDPWLMIADLRRQLAERTAERDATAAERDQALAREAATAEVLQVINSSPGDLAPVFDALLEKATRLCEAPFGVLWSVEDGRIRPVASHNVPDAYAEFLGRESSQPGPESAVARTIRKGSLFHFADAAAGEPYRSGDPFAVAAVKLGGVRSLINVPLVKDKAVFGIFGIYRQEVRPFSDRQVGLLQNFATQAVIAMENARLINETREALEQQTATAQVLGVINSSPGELAPVFDAMLEKAMRLCEAAFGMLWTFDGDRFHMAAHRGLSAALEEALRRSADLWSIDLSEPPGQKSRPGEGSGLQRLLDGEEVWQLADTASEPLQSGVGLRAALVELGGVRTQLLVALRKDAALLGVFHLYRREVRPFSEKQIALLQNFAAQAVIAMENARLINETREALEQQTATAEVLGVINSSPGDPAPVFDAILEKAHTLCSASIGSLVSFDGEHLRALANRGMPEAFDDFVREPFLPHPNSIEERLVREQQLIHLSDMQALGSLPDNPISRAAIKLGGVRTALFVPLQKDAEAAGYIAAGRAEVRPFSDKQIALLQNFAAQAVIAMENARLLTETREALEQQTATAEVLQVVNSSPGDLAPVFEAILEKAHTLCGAAHGSLGIFEGETWHAVVQRGYEEPLASKLREPARLSDNPFLRELIDGAPFLHVADLAQIDHPIGRANVAAGIRALLIVPLRKDDAPLGTISIARREVRPFSDKEIALLQNFAAQAVIAMENARLLTETRESLEQQTATAEVLQVINSSPGDLTPVFDALLEKAMRLCDIAFGTLWTFDGTQFQSVAQRGVPTPLAEFAAHNPLVAGPATDSERVPSRIGGRLLQGEPFVHIPDLAAEEAYRIGDPHRRALVDLGGARTGLAVALRKETTLLGLIMFYRQEVRPFTDKQIALLQNFAAQAVIAMENARLLGELRERTSDLEESLEYQTATSDVLQVISRSTFDLQPVLDTLVQTVVRLCGADWGNLTIRDGEVYRPAAIFGLAPEREAFARKQLYTPGRGTVVGRALLEGTVVHSADMAADPEYASAPGVRYGGTGAVLGVPLLREGEPLGALALARKRTEPFTERQIELVRTFADQAVIAIENTRLITETREALEQQTATAEILEVINRSPGNLAPVFDAILEKGHSLCGADIGRLFTYDGECFSSIAARGAAARYGELRPGSFRPPPGNPFARLLEGQHLVHIADVREVLAQYPDDPGLQVAVEIGMRAFLLVPLRKDDALLGAITASRTEVRPFSDKQISLLESFAAQAVIAMDNARLLNEIRQRQAELRVTFDNMGDGVAMFDAELRLAAWNLNFQRILELPDGLLAERPRVGDFIRFLATHGEFGAVDIEAEVRRLSERVGTQWSAERARPDGRVIEVRSNPVPGGGVVLIYSDITERKRAEAEISAARDTAEKALQELQTAQASLLHAQKMAALGQLTAGIAHEIKNPLNFVNNFAELSGELLLELKETTAPAMAALGDDERAAADEVVAMLRGNLDKIAEHGKRADGIVKSMLEHSRGVSGERRVVDLNALIEEALNLAYHGARAQDSSFNITLDREFDRGLAPLELAPQEITRVFLNLFGNGFYAAAKRQRDGAERDFRPILRVITHDLGEMVEVRVRDNGTGIAPEIRDKLFQPFVTTKPTGEGTGLGLSIAWDVVTQQHGGVIAVDSREGEFTEFTIRLPRRVAAGADLAASEDARR